MPLGFQLRIFPKNPAETFIRVFIHGPEFQHMNFFAVDPQPRRPVKNGSGTGKLHQQRQNQEQRQKDNDRRRSQADFKNFLRETRHFQAKLIPYFKTAAKPDGSRVKPGNRKNLIVGNKHDMLKNSRVFTENPVGKRQRQAADNIFHMPVLRH